MRTLPTIAVALYLLAGCTARSEDGEVSGPAPKEASPMATNEPKSQEDRVVKSDAEWRRLLTPEQYHVLREKGTDRAFTGAYWDAKESGTYRCAACDAVLFRSETKFDAGCGWPSFYKAAKDAGITETRDSSHGMMRTEVTCSRCGAHLGHLFDDGPEPTGLRYCINGTSLKLDADKPK